MQLVADSFICFVVDSIFNLIWICFKIIKLICIKQMNNKLVAFCGDCTHHLQAAKAIMIHFISCKLCKYCIIYLKTWIVNLCQHTLSFHCFWNWQFKIVHNCWCNINVRCHLMYYLTLCTALNNQRNISYFLVCCCIL